MAVDIYFKSVEYPYYNSNDIEIEERLDIFLQQLEMIITTKKGSVLGDPNFGVNLDSYIWNFGVSSNNIKQEIFSQISDYIDYDASRDISYDIEISFLKGEIWDTIIVDVTIDGTKVAGYAVTP
jgi:hypothetical protein